MQPISVEEFNNLLREKVLIYDGAMGTNLQTQGLTSEDFGGRDGCSEALNLYCPESVIKVHCGFLEAGCQVLETNTFGGTRITLREYQLEDRVEEINRIAVDMAREAIRRVPRPYRPLIAGSIGPGSLLPSLGNIGFDEMAAAYEEQMSALLLAGIDIFQIETCQDLLQIKSALYAAESVFSRYGRRCPVVVSVTLEPNGTMLVGSDISAITTVLEPYDFIDMLGINCATGPLEMVRHVAHLAEHWPRAVGVMPNAGLPENVDGKPFYRMTPDEFADFHERFVREYGVNMVGGCCGTRPDHLAAVVSRVQNLVPAPRNIAKTAKVASLFSATTMRQQPAPAMVGERTNANGARQFKDLLLADDYDGMVGMGREQAKGGAHMLDLCVAYVGRDEVADMRKLVPMFATQVNLPLVIDSTSPDSIEAALKSHGGRCVINSVNLEDGGERLRRIAALARRFGAALICLTIDEEGMAKTAEKKLAIASRMRNLLASEFGFRDSDLIFDALTFTVASGDSQLRSAAAETLRAIELVSREFPQVNTILGVSNVSFGLQQSSREMLNSVFLAEAVAKGLTCAIVNPARIIPMFSISESEKKLALDLIFNTRGDGSELTAYMDATTESSAKRHHVDLEKLPTDQRLFEKVVEGDSASLDKLLEELRLSKAPVVIINEILLPAMKKVGEYFATGRLQLPFVLQSAEVVKKSVDLLKPFMEKTEADPDKKMILATVAGDVHDIGKNLVNIMLSNNGYSVVDLGIKVDIDAMIKAAHEHKAGVIGMSGLLVRSTQIMKENLEELNRREFLPAVILGGAALTPDYVNNELKSIYDGKVFYARDAIDSIRIMEELTSKNAPVAIVSTAKAENETELKKMPEAIAAPSRFAGDANRHQFLADYRPLHAPFYGNHLLEIESSELFKLLSHKVLFEARWGFKQGELSENQYRDIVEKQAKPALKKFIDLDESRQIFENRAVYGYYRCKAQGESIKVLDETGLVAGEFSFPRQNRSPNLCLSDFVGDNDDTMVFWAVTVGNRVIETEKELFGSDKYCDYHLLHGLGAELADCAAVFVHRHIHRELHPDKPLTDNQLVGCRYSFGYPACPDLTAQRELLRLLQAQRIGLSLTASDQMVPELSVSGFIILNHHARYFVP
ncbi:MAG: methionine synthase [Candidatus Riflebacteria bacterium]|nr:methionine synthase [Candidatus Riflebacteria bacterium]